jgi:hypothetical protein
MAYDEKLAARIRAIVTRTKDVTETKMFGACAVEGGGRDGGRSSPDRCVA